LSASTEYRTLLGLADKALVRLLIAMVAPGGKVMVTLSDSGVDAGLAGASGMDRGVGVGVNMGEGGGLTAGVTAAVCKGTWAAGKDGKGNIAVEVTPGIEMGVGVTGWGGNVRAGGDGAPVTDDRDCEGDDMGEDKNKVVGEFEGRVGDEGVVCGAVVLDGGLTTVCMIAGG